jgi:2-polyprenyl-3-methyl-5-hydroxy-6-metoxy-1,4-benzoquinol methylase
MNSPLVSLFGFPAALIHHDTLVLDRWLWLKSNLPRVPVQSKRLIDIGCGSGAFTIGAALRGYDSLGLSWDERNQRIAAERAAICKAPSAHFDAVDVRKLDTRKDLYNSFDVAVCCETIEHILNDTKLMVDISRCLKPGGTLLLTSPSDDYRPIAQGDAGPFLPIENGGHVRKGYTPKRLTELCAEAGMKVVRIGYCSGFFSQKITALQRGVAQVHTLAAWAVILPLRVLPPTLDSIVSPLLRWPGYCITLVATKI